MPEISVQHQPKSLTDLELCDTFGEPVGPLPKQTDKGFYNNGKMITSSGRAESRRGWRGSGSWRRVAPRSRELRAASC